MDDLGVVAKTMREHYEGVWQAGDAWSFESSEYEQTRYRRQLSLLTPHRFGSVLEIGCGSGVFTQLLATVANRVVALDIADAAIQRAKQQPQNPQTGEIEFVAANAMEYDLQDRGPWDLIVLSEAIYCLGWLYSFFKVAWFASQLLEATQNGGRLLLTNTYGHERDYLMRPWLIRTYRDLFLNVGYQLEHEEIFVGTKDGVEFEVLMSLFQKPSANS